MNNFFVGIDLGQSQDYTASSILERMKRNKETIYNVRHLERVRGEPYPSVVNKIVKIVQSKGLKGHTSLVVDQTSVGAPVVDLFKDAGLEPIGVHIHGGDTAAPERGSWRVPKRDLVGVMKVLLQTERLKVASKLKLGPILLQELRDFKVKIDPETAHDSYSAWREKDHDDLVLSTALAAWYGESAMQEEPIRKPRITKRKSQWKRKY